MSLLRPGPAAALLGLLAMKTMAGAAGAIGPSQRALMEAARRIVLPIDANIDALQPINPAELAAGFPLPGLRRQFGNGMLVVALAAGLPPRAPLSPPPPPPHPPPPPP